MKHQQQFEPGDMVAWYYGLATYRGHVEKVFDKGRELVVISTTGVRHYLAPEHQQVDLLGPLSTDPIGVDR